MFKKIMMGGGGGDPILLIIWGWPPGLAELGGGTQILPAKIGKPPSPSHVFWMVPYACGFCMMRCLQVQLSLGDVPSAWCWRHSSTEPPQSGPPRPPCPGSPEIYTPTKRCQFCIYFNLLQCHIFTTNMECLFCIILCQFSNISNQYSQLLLHFAHRLGST